MKDYSYLLNDLNENSKEETQSLNDRVLLIDSMNMFLRSFAVINKVNKKGHHIGGLTGYLRSLGAMIELIQPTRVIAIFDGEGNVTNKKNLYSGYKGNRKIKRITNWSGFDSLQEESESIETQLLRLIDYLKCLPINISIIDKQEADDVIAYIAPKFKQSIIVSADQDFLQLVDDTITVYSPIKKKFYDKTKVFEEFGLYPHNFLIQKTILGDTSDNVPKVPKLGPKKLFKHFPELKGEESITLDYIIESSLKKSETIPICGNIYNFRKQLKINEKLMDLSNPNLPKEDRNRLDELINEKPFEFNSNRFIQYYNIDNLENSIYNVNFWLNSKFNYLIKFK